MILWICATYYSYDMAPMGYVLSLASSIVSIFLKYYLCQGHVDTLLPVDRDLSDKWASLWQTFKWTLIFSTVGVFALALISSVISSFLLTVTTIALIILYVMEIVYLFRNAVAANACKKQLETEFPET